MNFLYIAIARSHRYNIGMNIDSVQNSPLLQIRGLHKVYDEGGRSRVILDRIDLDIYEGEFFVILGKSGSGKKQLISSIPSQKISSNMLNSLICRYKISTLWSRVHFPL